MKPLTVQGVVLLVMLLALPFASLGVSGDATWASVTSLVLVGGAALVPPAMRFVGPGTDDDAAADAADRDEGPFHDREEAR